MDHMFRIDALRGVFFFFPPFERGELDGLSCFPELVVFTSERAEALRSNISSSSNNIISVLCLAGPVIPLDTTLYERVDGARYL
jgi:hypothetical protein